MVEPIVIRFTSIERAILDAADAMAEARRMADIERQVLAAHSGTSEQDVRAAMWRLLADRYLVMSPVDRRISLPTRRQEDEPKAIASMP